jgi:UDP-glucose 4-epimerase
MKKAIVFGCNGYLGRNMSWYLQQQGWTITGADIQPIGFQDSFDYYCIDVADAGSIAQVNLSHFELIFFFSGLTGTWNGFEQAESYLRINELGLLHFIRQYHQQNATGRIVFPSTRLVYKGIANTPLKETDELLPLTPYAINKIACEHYLAAYKKAWGIHYTVFRLCIPYGNLTDATSSYGTIGFFESMASKGQSISLYGDGQLKRTFSHMQDIVTALLQVSTMDMADGETYNLGGETFSLLEVAELVAKKYGTTIAFAEWPSQAAIIESGDTIFDSTKIEALGISTSKKLKENL